MGRSVPSFSWEASGHPLSNAGCRVKHSYILYVEAACSHSFIQLDPALQLVDGPLCASIDRVRTLSPGEIPWNIKKHHLQSICKVYSEHCLAGAGKPFAASRLRSQLGLARRTHVNRMRLEIFRQDPSVARRSANQASSCLGERPLNPELLSDFKQTSAGGCT